MVWPSRPLGLVNFYFRIIHAAVEGKGFKEFTKGMVDKKKKSGYFPDGGEGSDPIPGFFFLEGKF